MGFASPQVVNIGDIAEKDISDEKIKVEGTVNKIIPLLDRQGFEIKDPTGSIWVITHKNVPKIGDRITVEGILKSKDIVIDGEEFKEFYLIPDKSDSEATPPN